MYSALSVVEMIFAEQRCGIEGASCAATNTSWVPTV